MPPFNSACDLCCCVCAGEMERHTGTVRVGGQLALVAQQAWIINASVRDNILLGRDLDEARWEACVEACCLSQDFKVSCGAHHWVHATGLVGFLDARSLTYNV